MKAARSPEEEALTLLGRLVGTKGGCTASIRLYDSMLSGEKPIGRTTLLLAKAEGRDVMQEIKDKRNKLVERRTQTQIAIDDIREAYPTLEADVASIRERRQEEYKERARAQSTCEPIYRLELTEAELVRLWRADNRGDELLIAFEAVERIVSAAETLTSQAQRSYDVQAAMSNEDAEVLNLAKQLKSRLAERLMGKIRFKYSEAIDNPSHLT